MRREAPILVLVVLLLAGCVQTPAAVQPASTPGLLPGAFGLDKLVELKIPVPGGVSLHGTVYLPNVTQGTKVPVVMDMGPYFGNLRSETYVYNEKHAPNLMFQTLLEHGYAVAFVSVRGTGQSEGCFMIGGAQERADVAATVEWLATQEWSDGNVAMTGVSYDGTTPWEGYVANPPHLKAIIPVEGISDYYRYSFFEGVPVGGGAAFNTYYLAEVDVAYDQGSLQSGKPQAFARGAPAWVAAQSSNVCPEQADVYLTPYQTYADGVHNAYWKERNMAAMLENGTAAVLVVHGFKDFNVKMDHVQTIWASLPEPKRMLLGQWEHNIPWRNTYDKTLSYEDYNATMLSFLDAYVKGDPAALQAQATAPKVTVQTSGNRTLFFSQWPPAEVEAAPFYLAPNALAEAPSAPSETTIRTNPASQALSLAGAPPDPLSDAAVFKTPAFETARLFAGNPHVDLNVSVDQPRGMLSVDLYVVKDTKRELISEGWQNLATRESREKASSVPTGTMMQVRILMEALAQDIPAGAILELHVSGLNADTLTPQAHMTTFTIKLGGPEGAALVLPEVK